MAVLPIITYNDKILRTKADPVKENTDELQRLIDDMFETMYFSDGVGLAAPQIGKSVRLFVADAGVMENEDDQTRRDPLCLINPEITAKSEEEVELEEGCLSIPGVNGPVVRPEKVTVTYLDRDFEKKTLEASGWLARIIQHERDHLDGILFLDYLSSFKKARLSSQLKDIARGRKETEYPIVPKKAASR